MATTDPVKWLLLDTDLSTRIGGDLPVVQSHLYLEINEPGSGEIRLPLDTTGAGLISSGQFVECFYRGSSRGGFFVDNIKQTKADESEGAGRFLSVTGRGALGLLEDVIIWSGASGETTREYTSATKASILIDLILEAQARGGLSNLTYDFTDTEDSDAVAWTDSEDYKLPVGTSLLDVARQFAKTGGFDYEINLSGGNFVLSAYSGGIGSDISSTIYFRTGINCEEIGQDERGDQINNAYLTKYRDGFVTSTDSASIAARRRREVLLSLEQAQTSTSAITYTSAKLSTTKDPLIGKTIRMYDGVDPNVFLDYNMGDTIRLDVLGSETDDRILGIQIDFGETELAHVVVELNSLIYDNEMRTTQQLEWLAGQWNTAKDSNLSEVNQWLSIGEPNGAVYALHVYSGYLYVGGAFTTIGSVSATRIAKYQLSTGLWSATDAAGISADVIGIINVGSTLYAITAVSAYKFTAGAWAVVGTRTGGEINSLTTDNTNLYVGGTFNSIDSGAGGHSVAMYNGSVWSTTHTNSDNCNAVTWFSGKLYATFSTAADVNKVRVFSGGSWSAIFGSDDKSYKFLGATSTLLYFMIKTPNRLVSWDGVAGSYSILGTVNEPTFVTPPAFYLTDLYAEFNTGGIQPTKYSGGIFSILGTGISGGVRALALNDTDVYVGGTFTTAGGSSIPYLAVYVTDFQSMVNHLSNDTQNNFNMAEAINSAPISAITDNDKMGFWEDVSSALRAITWANIKATLKTYFDTLYQAIGTIPNPFALPADITPSTLSADQNDYNPTGLSTADVIRLEASTPVSITGIQGGADGRILVLYNKGSIDIYLDNQSGSSSAANRFSINNDTTLFGDGGSIALIYDATDSRWRPLNLSPAAFNGTILDIGVTADAGVGETWARGDHIHAGPKTETNTNNIFRCDTPGGTSAFAGTIATLPGGATLTYNVTSGTEGAMVPLVTTNLAKMRLYNTTRGTNALISNCNTGTNTITLTANVPAGWATTDVITIASQTVTGAPVSYVDLEITSGPTDKTYMFLELNCVSATPSDNMRLHPFETFGASKQLTAQALVANLNGMQNKLIKITSNVFSLAWTGTPTNIIITENGYLV